MLKFSLILPIFNVENFIGDCLDSLLSQDISEDEYEIICVNDGSFDSSAEVVKKYMVNHSNIILLEQQNAGVCAARNRGFEVALGEYIWFIDPDDMIATNCLKRIYSHMKCTNADILEFGYETCDETTRYKDMKVDFKIDGYNKKDSSGSGCLAVCRSSYLKSNYIVWDEHLSYGEDYLWAFQIKYRKHESIFTNSALYFYRQRSGSAMHSANHQKTRKHMDDMIRLYAIYENEYKRCVNEGFAREMLLNIRKRQQLCIESALFYLMKLRYDSKQLNQELNNLKNRAIYPYKLMTWNWGGKEVVNPLKFRIFTFLFPIEPYYKLVCKAYRCIRWRKK